VSEFTGGGVGTIIDGFCLGFIISLTAVSGSVPILGYRIGNGPDLNYSLSVPLDWLSGYSGYRRDGSHLLRIDRATLPAAAVFGRAEPPVLNLLCIPKVIPTTT